MKDSAGDDSTVIERLEGALEAEALPKAARDYARHLVRRLSQPVRVSLLGFPGAGKSQLVNMFLGEQVVPEGAVLPTTEYAWGEAAQMIITGTDGVPIRVHGADLAQIPGKSAAFLRIELPIPILQRINLLEVVTDGSSEELNSGVDWVVRRTDIALWCTQEFAAPEQAIWRRVPDSLKDHAFLVLTKADKLSAQNMLRKRVSSLETVVAEEFHSLFAVATLQALRAFKEGNVDEAMFHASGGGALTSEVLRHAERGRRADFDSAHMFLARYQVDEGGERRTSRGVSSRGAPAPAVEEPAVASPEPAVPSQEVPAEAAPTKPDTTPEVIKGPQVAAAAVAAAAEPIAKVENVALFSDAIRFLRRRGDSLAKSAEELGEGSAKGLIDNCVSAVEHLADLFSEDESGCQAADAFIDELAEAQDMMVLMQVEDGDGPAADAITLLLQLRRDMEMQLAA
ncbi:MAG: hypothetical protein LJE62_05325 [Silicimonas sp.]|jgi:hypothetical protein|nr:hypothetical protein [Silicimonas sp.]